MEKVVLLHNPRCSKSRGAIKFLQGNNIPFETREYLKCPLSIDELKEVSEKLKLPPLSFIRTTEAVFKENKLANKNNDELFQAIADYPILMERPIILVGEKAVVGRPIENIKNLIVNVNK